MKMKDSNWKKITQAIEAIDRHGNSLHDKDWLLTWQKSDAEIEMTAKAAMAMHALHNERVDTELFRSGLAVSIFRDKSTRTRFSFASAANQLGLAVQDMDETKSQVAHGETVRETANMISFLTEVIGIRDDLFVGEGHKYMKEVSDAIEEGHKEGVLDQRTSVVNLQCDLDHPTQSMADLCHLVETYGSFEALKGKKLAMTWAYSPSYGKPLSVPQGIITLLSRFGMDLVLAHPEGYDLQPDTLDIARKHTGESGGSFNVVNSMEEAFEGADIVYPKSWAPFSVMEKRTNLLRSGRGDEVEDLEKEALANNANFKNWECDADKMKVTRDGEGLYMHCLPADITDVSCKEGEVAADVFEKYRLTTYREAAFKPFVISAMVLLNRSGNPARNIKKWADKAKYLVR